MKLLNRWVGLYKLSVGCLIIIGCLVCPRVLRAQQHQQPKKKNILFIAIDDLRPELGCYGASHIKSPHIDQLAKQGVVFENAYCQQAVCAPSRNSVMTGLRPDAIGIYDLSTFFRTKVPDVVTLPQQFKNEGYVTEMVGKIYHVSHGNHNDSLSWNTVWNYKDELGKLKKINRGDTVGLESSLPAINGEGLPYYRSDAPEEDMIDGVVANIATKRLRHFKQHDEPFFMAVGFRLPHLPFVAPAKYWDMYRPEDIQIPERIAPEGASKYAFVRWSGELRKYHGIDVYKQQGVLPDELSRNLIHGYYAAVSMVDAQVGKLLNTLEELGLRENTIVVLWGDHGWKLGEYGMWCKHSNSELDTRTVLMISDGRYKQEKSTKSLVELLDIYPTLCELADIKTPDHVQGESLVPILKNPAAKVKDVAMSQYPRGKMLNNDPNQREIMGYSITDGRYRFTRWQSYENPKQIFDTELYNHADGRLDIKNLAHDKAYETELERMEKLLDENLSKTKKHH